MGAMENANKSIEGQIKALKDSQDNFTGIVASRDRFCVTDNQIPTTKRMDCLQFVDCVAVITVAQWFRSVRRFVWRFTQSCQENE